MATAALAAAKQQLRAQMKLRLAALSPPVVSEQSNSIFQALVGFPPFARARRVAIFLSMPTAEVQTEAIVRHALAAGKQVFVPYLHKPAVHPILPSDPDYAPARVMDMVQLHDEADYDALQPDRWGIPSISPASVPGRRRVLGDGLSQDDASSLACLDLILMPGVAFDVDPASGHVRRCGHGRGFYDFFLNRYVHKTASSSSSSSSPSTVGLYGLALAEQVLPGPPGDSVPIGQYDQTLDGMITGAGTIVTSPA